MKKVFPLLLLMLYGCIMKIEKPSAAFLSTLNEPPRDFSGSKLKFNGFYENSTFRADELRLDAQGRINTDKYYSVKPMFFFINGLVIMDNAVSYDSTSYVNFMGSKGIINEQTFQAWGPFSIRHDTIRAIVYHFFFKNAAIGKRKNLAYFEGILKDSATIINWKMVPPYPKVNMEANGGTMESEKKESTLKFVAFPAKANIDSNNVWINKYKTNKETR
jgi:hypothetical protein